MFSQLLYTGSCAYIIYPPITKIIDIQDKNLENTIGKIFINNRNAFFDEYNIYKLIIKKIDPVNEFTLKLIQHNAYKLKKHHLKQINNDIYYHLKNNKKLITDNLDIYEMIIEKGEQTLYDFLNLKLCPIEIFKPLFLNILLGIKKLHDNNFLHLDIKETNIMLLKNKLYLIDFGISTNLYDLYDLNKITLFNQMYIYYPFETIIVNHIYIKLYSPQNVLYSINDIITFIKENKYNIIETYVDKYYNYLNNYLYPYTINKDILIEQVKTFFEHIINKEFLNIDFKQELIKCIISIFQLYGKKIDIFSIGIMFYRISKFIVNNNKLLDIIPLLINFNPDERLDINQFIEYFNKL